MQKKKILLLEDAVSLGSSLNKKLAHSKCFAFSFHRTKTITSVKVLLFR